MSQTIVQAGDVFCSTGGAAGKASLYIYVPISMDCPIGNRIYETFDINDVHASHGDIDPMAFSGNTAEGAVLNGYKTSNSQTEGIELTQSLTILKGGDNSFIRRYETLADDIGGEGGRILGSILIGWESTVDGITPTLTKKRLYLAAIDSGDIPNTDSKADQSEYAIEVKFQGRPLVMYDNGGSSLLDSKISLTVTETLAYDDVTKMVSGIITVNELVGNESTAVISLIDPMDRSPLVNFGTSVSVKSTTGDFEINTLAPTQEDTTEIQISVVIAGVIVAQKTLTVGTPVTMLAKVNNIKETAANAGVIIDDVANSLKGKTLTYKVSERVTKKIVDNGTGKDLSKFEISNLEPNKDYVLGIYYNNREMATHNFRTPKDVEAPKIDVLSNNLTVKIGDDVSKEAHIKNNGLKVVDKIDGDLTTTSYVTVSDVDTTKKGVYYQIINAVDKSGNKETKEIEITVK